MTAVWDPDDSLNAVRGSFCLRWQELVGWNVAVASGQSKIPDRKDIHDYLVGR
jgi:hypothetical protein